MKTVANAARCTTVARLIAAFATSAVLVACSANSQLASTTPQQPVANPQMRGMQRHGNSWMDPAAKSHKLLYISDFGGCRR